MAEYAPSAVDRAMTGARTLVAVGGQRPGTRLPAERKLAGSFGVSRTTLRIALLRLADEGLVVRHPQRGWFVRDAESLADDASELMSFSELTKRRGFTATSHVFRQLARRATLEESEVLQVAPASMVIDLARIRFIDGIATCVDESVLVSEACGPVMVSDMNQRSLFDVLAQECRLSLFRSTCTIQAEGASREIADQLELNEGAPVLTCVARTIATNGLIVMASRVTYRGDSYRFHADQYRR